MLSGCFGKGGEVHMDGYVLFSWCVVRAVTYSMLTVRHYRAKVAASEHLIANVTVIDEHTKALAVAHQPGNSLHEILCHERSFNPLSALRRYSELFDEAHDL